MKHCISFLVILFFLNSLLIAQNKYNVEDDNINGIYLGYNTSGKRKLTKIYVYKYYLNNQDFRFLCKTEQYQSKKAKGVPTVNYFTAKGIKTNYGLKNVNSIGQLINSNINLQISSIEYLQNDKFKIKFKRGISEGNYLRTSPKNNEEFDNFLDEFYSNLVKTFYGSKQVNEIILGSLDAKKGRGYSKPQSGITLKTTYNDLAELHNSKTLMAEYKYTDLTPKIDKFKNLNNLVKYLMSYKFKNPLDPFIYHFPNIKEIYFRDVDKPEIYTHKVSIQSRLDEYRFSTSLTDAVKMIEIEQRENEIPNKLINLWNSQKKDLESKGITEEYITENINPLITSKDKSYKFLFGTNKANFFLIFEDDENSLRSETRAKVYVINDVEIDENFADLNLEHDVSYTVSKKYINKLERDVLPKVAEKIPKVNQVRFFYRIEDQSIKYPDLGNNNLLDFYLDRIYPTGIVDLYTTGTDVWEHENFRGSLVLKNSKSIREALKKSKKPFTDDDLSSQRRLLLRARESEKELTLLQQKERLIAYYKKNKIIYKKPEFWKKFGTTGEYLEDIYNGNFSSRRPNLGDNLLFIFYVNHVANVCSDLLPKNKKELISVIKISEEKYSHSSYNGNWSFTNYYQTEYKLKEYSLWIDPKYEDIYNISSDNANQILSRMAFHSPREMVANIKGYNKVYGLFFKEMGCDKNSLKLLGENLFRFNNRKESVQIEQGIYKK